MNARQFFDLVAEMRSAQKSYYSLRRKGADADTVKQALHLSISLESQVDMEVSRVKDILSRKAK